MEVILSKNVDKLGRIGDIVKVKEGFARNFLFPKKMAHFATPTNVKRMEQEKAKRVALDLQQEKEAQELADKLSKVSCTVAVEVNDLDKLYGSVTETDIVKTLKDEGFDIDKKTIILEKPIEELGIFEIGIKLHPQVVAKVRLWVTKK